MSLTLPAIDPDAGRSKLAKMGRATNTPPRSSSKRRDKSGYDSALYQAVPVTLEPESSNNTQHHNTCLELLVAGHVTAFIELFDLTGRDPDKRNLADDSEKLGQLGLLLARRDNAVQAGERSKEHGALVQLADTFEDHGDLNTAKHFRDSALVSASKLGAGAENASTLAVTHEKLALVLEKQGLLKDAVGELQQMRALAISLNADEGSGKSVLTTACRHLVRINIEMAEKCASGKFPESLERLNQAAEFASEGGEADLIADCWFRLGNAHEELGQVDGAIEHLENYLQYAKKQGDEKGQNHACSVLAKCYERKDDIPQATAYLKRLIKTSERAGQHKITSEAASRLGKLFARTNEHEEAVHWQTQAFESAKLLDDLKWVTACQIQLGQARALAMREGLSRCLVNNKMTDIVRLLMWKSHREDSFTEESVLIGFNKPGSAAAARVSDLFPDSTAAAASEQDVEIAVEEAPSENEDIPGKPNNGGEGSGAGPELSAGGASTDATVETVAPTPAEA